jgi:hypothetical protein
MQISRANFLCMLSAPLLLGAGGKTWAVDPGRLRGDPVGWARLKTSGEFWMRHAAGDPKLMSFLREHTTLNIDPTWYVADVQSLAQMCSYPLLFSQDLAVIQDASGRANVAEFMRRGGFMLVDACCNITINPDHDAFLTQQINFLKDMLPEAKVVALPSDHPVYRDVFPIPGGHPPHTFFNNIHDPKKARHGLYGIMVADHLAGMISLSGMQCGWSPMGTLPPPGHREDCMRMLVNIYTYAMLHGADAIDPGAPTSARSPGPASPIKNFKLLPPTKSQ